MDEFEIEQFIENNFVFAAENELDGFRPGTLALNPDQIERVKGWLSDLLRSSVFVNHLNQLLQDGPIFIGGVNLDGVGQWGFGRAKQISLDFSHIDAGINYFNNFGEVVKGRGSLMLAHEFMHLSVQGAPGPGDPESLRNHALNSDVSFDYDGPAVDFQNAVATDLANSGVSDYSTRDTRVNYNVAWLSGSSPILPAAYDFESIFKNDGRYAIDFATGQHQRIDVIRHGEQQSVFVTVDLPDIIETHQIAGLSRDLVFGFGESDVITTGSGNDFIYAGSGSDIVHGGDGRDHIYGDDDDDLLYGESGDDVVYGGEADDTIFGGAGNDIVIGGARASKLDDSIFGVALPYPLGDKDTLDYRDSNFRIHIQAGKHEKFGDEASYFKVRKIAEGSAAENSEDHIYDIENVFGSSQGDVIEFELLPDMAGLEDVFVDLFDHAGNTVDTLSARDFNGSVEVDLRTGAYQAASGGGFEIAFRNVEAAVGGEFADRLNSGSSGRYLEGRGGQDVLVGGTNREVLIGGYKDDSVFSDDGERDVIRSGGGADLIYVGNEDEILDQGSLAANARVYRADGSSLAGASALPFALALPIDISALVGGKLLVGGKQEEEGVPIYFGSDGTRYSLSGGALSIDYGSGVVTIQGFSNGDAGIRLIDKEPDTDDAEERRDPLIIDLDGNRNVVTSLAASTAYFDLDNDGFAEHVAWSTSGDGFLVRDLNGNGQVDSGIEMFGTGSVDLDAGVPQPFGEEGFAELGLLDTNLDGAITAADGDFDTLRVWIDANGDAVTDDGELRTLAELGVVSIGVTTVDADHVDIAGDASLVTRSSTVLFADDSSRSIYDAYLSIDQYDARELLDPTLDLAGVADLPNILGTGTVSDLKVAMSRDPALEELVRELVELPVSEAHQILGRVERILLRWTGGDEVEADSRGANINAQWLNAIEQITGKAFNQAFVGTDPRGDAAAILIAEWREIVANAAAKLVGQSALGEALTPGLNFAAGAFYRVEDGTDLDTLLSNFAAGTPAGGRDAVLYWSAIVAIADHYQTGFGLDQTEFDARLSAAIGSTDVAIGLNSLRRVSTGGAVFGAQTNMEVGDELVSADDMLVAGADTAVLNGGGGDDTYIVGDSDDPVNIMDATGHDTLYLPDLVASELVIGTATIDGREMLTLSNSDGSISARFEFSISPEGLRSDVETVVFGDGSSRPLSDLVSDVLTDGSFFIGSTAANTVLEGNSSDNVLFGFGPSDQYRFGPGSGNDVVSDEGGSADRLVVNAALADVTLTRGQGSESGDVIITVNATGETVRVTGQRSTTAKSIELFELNDVSLTAAEIDQIFNTGTTGDDEIVGSARNDTIDGKAGSDGLRGGEGSDIYHFDLGWGNDIIVDASLNNAIEFGAGIVAGDIQASRGGASNADLVLTHSSGDSITVAAGLQSVSVGQLRFADGTILALTDLITQIDSAGSNVIAGTGFDDVLTGTIGADRFVSNGGNDIFDGEGGLDIYEIGSGRVTIYASDVGVDTVIAPDEAVLSNFRFADSFGLQLRFGGGLSTSRVSGSLDHLQFADGTLLDFTGTGLTAGSAGDDFLYHLGSESATFTAGAGNDVMIGSTRQSGRDTYVFEAGFGQDIIYDMGGQLDLVEFEGTELDLSNAAFERIGQDLVISFANTGDRLTIEGHFWNYPFYPDTQYFGESAGVIEDFSFNGNYESAGTINGYISRATVGDDIVMTGTGTSTQSQITRRNGGAGNDILIGGNRINGYDFDVGFGHDVIKDGVTDESFTSSDDFVYFGGLASTDVSITHSADEPLSVVFTILATGETLTIDGTPEDGFNGDWSNLSNPVRGSLNIESFVFSDITLDRDQVIDIVLAGEGTAGDDEIYGFNSGGRIDAGAGNDRIHLLNGRETIVLRPGGGDDIVDFAKYDSGDGGFEIEFDGIDLSKVFVSAVSEVNGIRGKHARIHTGAGTTLTILHGRDTSRYPFSSDFGTPYPLFSARAADGSSFPVEYLGQTGLLFGGQTQGGDGDDVLQRDPFASPEPFDPRAGDDIIYGSGERDTVFFDIGYGTDRFVSDPIMGDPFSGGGIFPNHGILNVVVGSELTSSDVSLNWLIDEPGLMELVIDATGDRLIFDPDRLGAIQLADTVLSTVPIGPDTVLAFEGDTVDIDPANERFLAVDGNVRVRFGEGAGNDSLSDARFDAAVSGTDDLAGWAANIVELVSSDGPGGSLSLDSFQFIRDIDNPANLVVIEPISGARLVIENQFAFGLPQLSGGWSPVDGDGDGTADWSGIDADDNGTADFAALDSDGDGIPDWVAPDFDGDGVADWETERYATLDSSGVYEIDAYDYDGDGNADEYDLDGPENVYLYDNDGDGVPDEYEIGSVGTIMPAPTDDNGNVDWLQLDADGDGQADLAGLDPDGDGQLNWFRGYSAGGSLPGWMVEEYTDLFGPSGEHIASRETVGDGTTIYSIPTDFPAAILARDIDGDLVPDQYGLDANGDGLVDATVVPGTPTVVEFFALSDFFDETLFTMADILPRMEMRAVPPGDSNGTVIDLAALQPIATVGADTLLLDEGESLDSLAGDDLIWSIGEGGVLHFGAGDGNDRLEATDPFARMNDSGDVVHFDGILDPAQLRFLRGGDDGSDLVVEISATGERLTLTGQLGPADGQGSSSGQPIVREFRFEGGLTLSAGQVARRVGNDNGGNPDDGGEDGPIASGDDGGVLGGDENNDDLRGGSGDDIYLFERGGAEDHILDAGGFDRVRFGEDISPADLYFSRTGENGEDLLIEILGLERLTLTISGQFGDVVHRVETFTFADGSSLDWRELQQTILDLAGTSADDTITGFAVDDVLLGKSGNDVLVGAGGDDRIIGGEGRDQVVFAGASDEYVVTVNGDITTVTDTIAGRDGTDTLQSVEDVFFLGDNSTTLLQPANVAPQAGDLQFEMDEDGTLIIDRAVLLATGSDGNADQLQLETLSEFANGQAWIGTDGNIRFRPNKDYVGDAGFSFVLVDGNGGTATARVGIAIQPQNDAPLVSIEAREFTAFEDSPIDWLLPAGWISDADGDPLTVEARLASGELLPDWLTFDGERFTGTPPSNFNGSVDIELVASDGTASATSALQLNILPVNDAPAVVANPDDVSIRPGEAFAFAVPAATFEDVENDELTFEIVAADGGDLPGWITVDGLQISGTAPADLEQPLEIAVVASDGRAASASVFSLVPFVDSAPVVNEPLQSITSNEDTVVDYAIPANAFVDPDGDPLTLAASLTDGSALPDWLTFDGAHLTGTPPSNFNGLLSVLVTASDGEESVSNAFDLTILPVNDAPALAEPLEDRQFDGNSSVQFAVPETSFADVDGDQLVFSATLADGSDLPAWLAFDPATRTFNGLAPDADAVLDIRVTASDGSLAVSDEFALAIAAQDAGGGSSTGFSFANLNSWYNPDWGGGYNVTFAYEVQPEAMAEGELKAWDILASYTGPGTIVGGWVDGFPGPATFTVTPEGAVFSTDGQDYQPELAEGQTFQITLQVDGAAYTAGDFAFEIFDRDPALNLADDQDTALTIAPTSDWGSGLGQSVSFTNASDAVIDDWQMVLDVPDGADFAITNVWDATATTLANGDILFEAVGSNEEVAPGGQAGFGFNASYSGVSGLAFDESDFSFTDSDARQFDVVVASAGGTAASSGWAYGTSQDDALIGNDVAANRIFGAVGDDQLSGGALGDWLAGGSGSDTLTGLDGDDALWGGHGNDRLYGGLGFDTAQLVGYRDSYSIVTQDGALGLRVTDLSAIAHGDDGVDQLSSIERLAFRGGDALNITSPIILDLDGDGIETVSAADSIAQFDLDSDGLADNTSWIGSGDAFLYFDRDGNGTISGVDEISFVDDVANAATDLDGLAAFDSNHDGVLDAQDDRFADFGAWRDTDGDGAVDAGETANLAQRGIVSIKLSGAPVEGVTEFGEVAIANTGSFTLANGAVRQFADAALTYFSAANVVSNFRPRAGSNDRVFDLTAGPVRASAEFFQLRRHISETRLDAVPMSELFDLLRADIGAAGTRLFDRFDSMFGDAVSAQRGARPTVPATSEASLEWPRGMLEPISPHFSRFAPFERLSLINEPLELQSRMQKLGGFGEEVPFDASDKAKRLHVIPARPTVLNAAIANDAEHANPAASDPELARKLAMIRQDMGAFGPNGAAELDRLHAPDLEYLQLYA